MFARVHPPHTSEDSEVPMVIDDDDKNENAELVIPASNSCHLSIP
jgi:hypothetical protein